jgi:SnoaL-like domain
MQAKRGILTMQPYDLRRHSQVLATVLVIGAIVPVSVRADRPPAGQLRAEQPGARSMAAASSQKAPLPALKRFQTPQAVVDEHLAAINACDWQRLMAQYPPEAQFFLPGGQVIKGRDAVGDLFKSFVRPVTAGGLCGLTFETENSFPVGDTINVQWVARASFLAEPYRGADAYVTKDGLMMAQVTTFDAAQIKKK